MPEPIVLEFIAGNGAKHYFIGTSVENIITDVKENFSFINADAQRQIPVEIAERLGFYRQGYEAVKKHGCPSFKLGKIEDLVESR